jgi:hypothetical protein
MKYRFWVYQDMAPPGALAGNPQAPKPDEPVPADLLHPGREVEGVIPVVGQIVEVFQAHGVDGIESAIIQGKAMERLSQGSSYRSALPTPGRWLLAEPVTDQPHPLDERTQA